MPTDPSSSNWEMLTAQRSWSRPVDGGYRLWLHRPDIEGEDAPKLPILWLLDAGTLFPIVSAALDWLTRRPDASGVAPMILAGIDRDVRDPACRYRDFTFGPPADPAGQVRDVEHGGGPQFAETLAGCTAFIDGADADLSRQGLVGHSLGGLFALYMLARSPGRFRTTAAVSPSIWWDRAALEEELLQAPDHGQNLFIGAGGHEEPGTPRTDDETRRTQRAMVTNASAVAALLADRWGNERVHNSIAAGESHASTLVNLLPDLLRFTSAKLWDGAGY